MAVGVHEVHHAFFVVAVAGGEARPVVGPVDIEPPGLFVEEEAACVCVCARACVYRWVGRRLGE